MTDYYVDYGSGDDANDGSSSFPLQHVNAGLLTASAGDTVHIAAPKSSPCEDAIETQASGTASAPILLKGATAKSYVTSGALLINNGSHRFSTTHTYFQDSTGWSLGGTAALDAVNNKFGVNCISLPAVNDYAAETQNVPQNCRFKVHIIHKNAGSGTTGLYIKNNTDSEYVDLSTGAWDAAGGYQEIEANTTSWSHYATPWIDAYTTDVAVLGLQLRIACKTAGGSFVQEYWVEYENVATEVIADDVYSFPEVTDINSFSKCSLSDWNSSGIDALIGYPTGTVADIKAGTAGTEGQMAYDSTDRKWYYHLDSGETIDTVVLLAHTGVTGKGVLHLSHDYINVVDMSLSGGQAGVICDSTSAGCMLEKVDSKHNDVIGLQTTNSASLKHIKGEVSHIRGTGEGIQSLLTSTLYCEGLYVHHCSEDCTQPSGDSTATFVGCLLITNGIAGQISATCAEPDNDAGAVSYYNCVMINGASTEGIDSEPVLNDKCGINVDSIYKNNIFLQDGDHTINTNATNSNAARGAGTGSLVATNNYVWGAGANATTESVNFPSSTAADPKLTYSEDSSSLVFDSTSPCIAAGTKWWTGPNPVGADGEPFSDFDTDIGAIQSTNSLLHPKNL